MPRIKIQLFLSYLSARGRIIDLLGLQLITCETGVTACPRLSELPRGSRDNTGTVPALCQEHRRCSTSADTLTSSRNRQPSFPFLQAWAVTNHCLGHHFSWCFRASRALPGPRAMDPNTGEARRLSLSTRLPQEETQGEVKGIPTSWRGHSPPWSWLGTIVRMGSLKKKKNRKPQPSTWQPPPAKAELGCPHSCPPPHSEFLPLGQGLTYDREGVCLAVPCQEVTAVSCKAVHALIKGIDEVSSKEAAPGHRWLAQSPFSTKGPWRERPHMNTAGTNSSNHCSQGEMRLQPSEIRLQGRTFHLKRH